MRVIIAAAGTGGHINPAISIANKIKKEEPDSQIIFFGTERGIENDLVPRAGYKLEHIEAYGFKKQISIKNFRNILKTVGSIKVVKKFIDDFKPDVVIGTGGYICAPVFSAANSKKIPTVLHESNAFPGKAVRLFAKKANKVLLGFDEAKAMLPANTITVTTGNPTKVKKIQIQSQRKQELLNELNVTSELPIVLVTGGSQGAQKINEAIVQILVQNLNKDYQIIWATGPKQYDNIKENLEKNDLNINKLYNAKVLPYIYNMEEVLNLMDLQICRSGAMTITELCNVEKPAIFIPLPSVGANKQEENARVLEKIGAAKIILNNQLEYKKLNTLIYELISKPDMLKKMGKNTIQKQVHNVEDKIYKEIKETIEKK